MDMFNFFKFTESDGETAWQGYDFNKDSLAIIFCHSCKKEEIERKCEGPVMFCVGGHIKYEIEEVGFNDIYDLGLNPPSEGIWVWEGKFKTYECNYYCDPTEYDFFPVGKFRKPTEEELKMVVDGKCPWNDDEWRI
jgi:hypothetical protein